MNLDDSTYELIDQYLQGELQEDHPFVQCLQTDQELVQEVDLRKLIEGAVVDHRLLEVQKILNDNRSKLTKDHTSKWNWLFWTLPIVTVAVGAYFYTQSSTKQITKLQEEKIHSQKLISPQAKHDEPLVKKSIVTEPKNTKPVERTTEPNTQENTTTASIVEEPLPLHNNTSPLPNAPESKHPISAPTHIPVPSEPCLGIRIKAFVAETRPCIGTSEGQLTVQNTQGGKAPYRYAIDGKTFQEESVFAGLSENEYSISIKDANNCESIIYQDYSLKSKTCIAYAEYAFNPTIHTWEVPNDPEKQGEITIVNPDGQRVFSQVFNKYEKLNWAGQNNNGGLLLPSIYIYSIKYSDGVVEQGKITIAY